MAPTSAAPGKPRVFLMGLRRCGKSSIQKVVFHKMSPHETLFLEATSKIVKTDICNSAFLRFEVWDFPPPSLTDFTDQAAKWTPIFAGCSTLVWIVDAQDDYAESLGRLQAAVVVAARANPQIQVEIFVHKADSLGEEGRWEAARDVHEQMTQELANLQVEIPPLRVFLTSIYDPSVFECLSKVVQKLLPQLPTLQNLLDRFLTKCSGEKAFLFDMVSKLYLATDSSPVDMALYELCSDVIDTVIDISYIYGTKGGTGVGAAAGAAAAAAPAADGGGAAGGGADEGDTLAGSAAAGGAIVPLASAAAHSSATIRLSTGSVIELRHVDHFTALVTIMSDRTLDKHGLVEFNFCAFREAVRLLFEAPPSAPAAGAAKAMLVGAGV